MNNVCYFFLQEIRGKHYKSGNVRPNIDVMVEPREICRIVARFEDYASNSSWTSERDVSVPGQEENAEYEEMVENGTSTSRSKNETGSHLASQESCLNLERDPFGILPKSKSNSCRSAHRSQTSYSSQGYEDLESLASDLTVQEDYTDNAFPSIGSGNTDLHQGVNCVFDGMKIIVITNMKIYKNKIFEFAMKCRNLNILLF